MADRFPQDPGPPRYEGAPAYGRPYGRDFGTGGFAQGFDGHHGEGYGGSFAPMDYRREANPPVAGPHAGKGPQGWVRSDARIREAVCEALADDALIDARGIGVEVAQGVVTLTGHVPDPSDLTLAEMIARRSGGVREVNNQLEQATPANPRDPRPIPGVETGAEGSPLEEGERDEEGREEGPRHLPKLAT